MLNALPYKTWPTQRVAKSLKEYWKAWKSLVPDAFENAEGYVLLKTPGVFSLHILAFHVLEVLRVRGVTNPKQEDFCEVLKDLGNYATADFWSAENAEGAAMAGSMKGFSILADTMIEQLQESGQNTA